MWRQQARRRRDGPGEGICMNKGRQMMHLVCEKIRRKGPDYKESKACIPETTAGSNWM